MKAIFVSSTLLWSWDFTDEGVNVTFVSLPQCVAVLVVSAKVIVCEEHRSDRNSITP